MNKRNAIVSLIPIYILTFAVLIAGVLIANHSITTLGADNKSFQSKCIVIDPGHGGVDGGATSCSGILESTINLQISLKLDDLLHYLGIKTVMIRQTDCSVYTQGATIAQKKVSDLKERVRIVNQEENALLISIHQNHFSDSRYYGPQVFYGKVGESRALATTMQSALTNSLCPESKRKAKQATGVYLLDKIDREGILIECGFLSNYEEEAKLRNDVYQKRLCCVIASVCVNYLNNTDVT